MLEYIREPGPRPESLGVVREFLRKQGFRATGGANSMRFQRGSRLMTMIAFSPSQWRADLSISPGCYEMRVHTTGQIVTPKEREYFEAFMNELTSLSGGESHALVLQNDSASTLVARSAVNENIMVTIGFGVAWPVLVGVLYLISVPFLWAIVWGGLGAGALCYAWIFSARHRRDSGDR